MNKIDVAARVTGALAQASDHLTLFSSHVSCHKFIITDGLKGDSRIPFFVAMGCSLKDFSRFELPSLEQMVENYIRQGKVESEDFAALLKAREAKRSEYGELDTFKSLVLLKQRARAQRFVSYGDLATASERAWDHTVRARMSGPKGHLDRLLDLCRCERLPLLTAICVNKQNLDTGILEPPALAGFIAGAKRLGIHVGDEAAFLRQSQEDCFRWGRQQDATAAE